MLLLKYKILVFSIIFHIHDKIMIKKKVSFWNRDLISRCFSVITHSKLYLINIAWHLRSYENCFFDDPRILNVYRCITVTYIPANIPIKSISFKYCVWRNETRGSGTKRRQRGRDFYCIRKGIKIIWQKCRRKRHGTLWTIYEEE